MSTLFVSSFLSISFLSSSAFILIYVPQSHVVIITMDTPPLTNPSNLSRLPHLLAAAVRLIDSSESSLITHSIHLVRCRLRLPPGINFATEWLDELGRVCPKNVDYATQCPKGHALAPFDGSGEPPAQEPSDADVICRVCHGSTQRCDARSWLKCSVAGCCGGYAVCAECSSVLRDAGGAAPATDDFPCEVWGMHAVHRA